MPLPEPPSSWYAQRAGEEKKREMDRPREPDNKEFGTNPTRQKRGRKSNFLELCIDPAKPYVINLPFFPLKNGDEIA